MLSDNRNVEVIRKYILHIKWLHNAMWVIGQLQFVIFYLNILRCSFLAFQEKVEGESEQSDELECVFFSDRFSEPLAFFYESQHD
jgi:hypothetical protein